MARVQELIRIATSIKEAKKFGAAMEALGFQVRYEIWGFGWRLKKHRPGCDARGMISALGHTSVTISLRTERNRLIRVQAEPSGFGDADIRVLGFRRED